MRKLRLWEFQWGRSEREMEYIAAENFTAARTMAVEWIMEQRPQWMEVDESDIKAIKMTDQEVIVP